MQRIFSYIDEHIDTFVDELIRVCQQPSISATGEGIQETAELIQSLMIDLGGQTRLISTEGSPVVYSRFPGKSGKTLMFYNHYDVQPPGPRDAWVSDPFSADIRDGTIYCRGATDNKGNIMCRLKAVEAVLAAEGALPLTTIFVVEGEEEIGSPNLERFVRSHANLLKADGVVWEGALKDFDDRPEILLGVAGWCAVELSTRTANHEMHSLYSAVAPNALWNMVRTLNTLQEADGTVRVPGFYDDVRPPTKDELSVVENIPYDWERFKEASGIDELAVPGSDSDTMIRHLFQPTCNIVGLVGGYTGTGCNASIPNDAVAKVDFRLVPDQDPRDILGKVVQHIRACGLGKIDVKALGSIPPCRAPTDSDIAQAAVAAGQDAYGETPIVYPIGPGASPMYKLVGQLGIPAIMTGCAGAQSNMHGPNENLRIKQDFLPGIKHMAALIKRFAAIGA